MIQTTSSKATQEMIQQPDRLCKTCNAPLKSTGAECEDCLSDRHIAKPQSTDPLSGQRREVVELLKQLDCPNPIAVANTVFNQLAVDLPGLLKARALAAAGLSEPETTEPDQSSDADGRRPPIKRRSDHPGIGKHRGRYRARVWHKGKTVFDREFDTLTEAIDARAGVQ